MVSETPVTCSYLRASGQLSLRYPLQLRSADLPPFAIAFRNIVIHFIYKDLPLEHGLLDLRQLPQLLKQLGLRLLRLLLDIMCCLLVLLFFTVIAVRDGGLRGDGFLVGEGLLLPQHHATTGVICGVLFVFLHR